MRNTVPDIGLNGDEDESPVLDSMGKNSPHSHPHLRDDPLI